MAKFFHSYNFFWCTLFMLAALSSFTILTLAEKNNSKSSETTTAEESTSQEDNKEKRSQEEIMFGNQQNKPNGLVDDLMSMPESVEDNYNGSQAAQDSKPEETSSAQDETQSGFSDWDSAAYQETLPMVDLVNSLYPTMRQERPLRKRSLRSSIGQMIQKRGIRMPRRSMRLKRQVDVEDLLNLFENERFYNEDAQLTPHSFSGRARTVAKRHIPGRYSGYSETPEYRYPYVFQHRDNGILVPGNEESELEDDLLLLPPNSRYIDTRPQEEKNEGIQKWLNRHTIPSVFRVSKRSSPFFYPIDYRYIPTGGYKKRSNGNAHVGRYMDDESEGGGDFGKWGHVVQVPEAYASPEDIARLYGLANLLSDGDEIRKRPST
ncbi:uncharacterized protein [Parasteatoda tepidariorum]|uniref:uncharacterized protein isoform X1 n=1 Tax=Parasteatoda tepidariorum TaxID=114398 RepID=UPI001C718354|nr:uncharacterized protein LOC107455017 isoform X1 [Parasteatoda tepidariorum]